MHQAMMNLILFGMMTAVFLTAAIAIAICDGRKGPAIFAGILGLLCFFMTVNETMRVENLLAHRAETIDRQSLPD